VNNIGNLEALSSKLPINPLPAEIENFKNGDSWVEENNGFLYIYAKIDNENVLINKVQLPYLKFSSDNDFTLSVSNPQWDNTIEYSLDKGNIWSIWNGSQLLGTASQPIYLRGIGNTKITGDSNNYKWSFTGKYVTGNIETLLDYQTVANGQHPTMSDYCYMNMFRDCASLTTAPELSAITLTSHCYNSMFYGCTSLINAPELPATILASYCYSNMFYSCTSLTTALKLPATTLAEGCYCEMFSGCTSLTTFSKLPATTLADYCYDHMFYNCKSLTAAPELPATTSINSCYISMFGNCTSLTTAPELPATTLALQCYANMFSGCTSLITPPMLPATTLVSNCYDDMFNGCTSLTTLPELPATTLVWQCYYQMFRNCTSIKLSTTQDPDIYKYPYRIPTLNTGTTVSTALSDMFTNTGGTFTGEPTINTTYYTDHQPI
jgi:hypothetical protein